MKNCTVARIPGTNHTTDAAAGKWLLIHLLFFRHWRVARYNRSAMISAQLNLDTDRVQTYCREARRLRHRLRHAPARLHRSLRQLSPTAPSPAELTPNDRFAHSVARVVQSRTLRYSTRLKLLREAESLGIERFEANLIIAMVQHRLNALPGPDEISRPLVRPWMVAVALQIAILLAIASLWLR